MGEGILNAGVTVDAGTAIGFHRRGGSLHCDALPLDAIAREAGTPCYVYSASDIRAQYAALDRALAGVPHRLHYSVKANSNLAVLGLLRELGAGVDIVSGGELHRALAVGFRGDDVVFSGVGKTEREMREALAARVKMFNVESEGELERLNAVAGAMRLVAPIALRVNPEVTVDTPHPYTRTGEKGMKFGIPSDRAEAVGRRALDLPHVRLIGLDMHVGSQVADAEPYVLGISRLLELRAVLEGAGARIATLDIGGGLAVPYDAETPVDLDVFAAAVRSRLAPAGVDLIMEPGRFVVGNAGVLLTRVIDRKHSGGREFVVTDAGMTDLLRPSHYDAYHRIEPVAAPSSTTIVADVVGPVCESGDFLALQRELGDVGPEALMAVFSAGAYGFVMASNYNSRPRAAEVIVDGDRWAIIRARETYDDLVRHERAPLDWRPAS